MSTTPNRWLVRCDRADYLCSTQPIEVLAGSLAELRAGLRLRGWRIGPWREWSGSAHLDLCPTCVAFARRNIAENAALRTGTGTIG